MLPVGTRPSAIAFDTGAVTIVEMARGGFVLNLVGIVLITLFTYLLGGATAQTDNVGRDHHRGLGCYRATLDESGCERNRRSALEQPPGRELASAVTTTRASNAEVEKDEVTQKIAPVHASLQEDLNATPLSRFDGMAGARELKLQRP